MAHQSAPFLRLRQEWDGLRETALGLTGCPLQVERAGLTVQSTAFKSRWVKWQEKNHETRAGKPCKGEAFNISVLEDITKLFPEGAVLKPSAAVVQVQELAQSFSISHFGMAQGEHVRASTKCMVLQNFAWRGKGHAA